MKKEKNKNNFVIGADQVCVFNNVLIDTNDRAVSAGSITIADTAKVTVKGEWTIV